MRLFALSAIGTSTDPQWASLAIAGSDQMRFAISIIPPLHACVIDGQRSGYSVVQEQVPLTPFTCCSYSHIPGEQSKSGYEGVPQSRLSHVWVNTTVSRVDDGDTLLEQAERNLPC